MADGRAPRARLSLLMLAAWLCLLPAHLQAAPNVSGRLMRGDARVLFEWPGNARFTTRQSGNQLILTFTEPVGSPDFSAMLSALSPHVQAARVTGDGNQVTLTLDRPYQTRSFVSGGLTGIDLLDIDSAAPSADIPPPASGGSGGGQADPEPTPQPLAAPRPLIAPPPALPPVTPPPATSLDTPPPASGGRSGGGQAKPVEAPEPAPLPKTAPEPEPEPTAAPEPEPTPEPAATPPSSPPPASGGGTGESAEATAKAGGGEAPASAETVEETPAPAETPEPAPEPAEPAPEAPATPPPAPGELPVQSGELRIQQGAVGGNQVLRFPFEEPAAAAAFFRGDWLWVAFDASRNATLAFDRSGEIKALEQLPDAAATVIRLKVEGIEGATLRKEPDSEVWALTLHANPRAPDNPAALALSLPEGQQGDLRVTGARFGRMVTLRDPGIGDVLRIVPVADSGTGLAIGRRYVEFALLPSAQGLVIQSFDTEPPVEQDAGAVRIFALQELLGRAPTAQATEGERARLSSGALGPATRGEFLRSVNAVYERLQHASGGEQGLLWAELARLYLAYGMPHEALAVAGQLRQEDFAAFTAQRAAALEGAAAFLMRRPREAFQYFSDPTLPQSRETAMWQQAAGSLTGAAPVPFDATPYLDLLDTYPPHLRNALLVLSADQLVQEGLNTLAAQLLEYAAGHEDSAPVAGELELLRAKLFVAEGEPGKGAEILQRLAARPGDRRLRAQALHALTALQLKREEIDNEAAIANLERVRVIWRGDALEANTLAELGRLYTEEKRYGDALRAYREIVSSYPTATDTLAVAEKMAAMFVQLFNGGGADALQPLEALALYYEFRELTPIEAAGDRMIRNLADRLVAVDLLDKAAELLEHQIRFRLSGEERSRVGTQLALIHLLNRDPKPALEVLERTGYGRNPPELQNTRALLTAQALSSLGEHDRAIRLLEGNASTDAGYARLDIHWEAQDWENVIATGEKILGDRADPSQPVDAQETAALLKLAVAYIYRQEALQLRYLRDYFTPLVAEDNPHRKAFLYLTAEDGPLNHKNFAALAREISGIRTFLSGFEQKAREEGLGSAVE